jgi:hypothetical protein
MKKLILSLLAAGFAATSFAQANCAGGILLYGVGTYTHNSGSTTSKFANANSSTTDQPHYRMWEVSPGIGFNLTNNLTLGVDVNYTGSKTTYDRKDPSIYGNNPVMPATYGEDQVKTYEYKVGPFVRYTWPIGEHFFAYGQFGAHYMSGNESIRTVTAPVGGTSFTRDNKYRGFDVSYMPAVGIQVCKSAALTFGIGGINYEWTKTDFSTQGYPAGSDLSAKNSDFNITLGRQFNVGIQKTFGCGHKMRRGNSDPMDETRHIDTTDDTDSDSDGTRRRRTRRDDE